MLHAEQSDEPSGLDWCLREIRRGPWAFIQLRGEADWSNRLSDDEDIDLLGSQASIDTLLTHVYKWVQSRRCHARIVSRQSTKTQLTLFSIDGTRRVIFDLWIRLWQFDHKRGYLTYSASLAKPTKGESVARMPIEYEACVYLQHLICKKRNLQKSSAQRRLAFYKDACPDDSLVLPLLKQALQSETPDDQIDRESLAFLDQQQSITRPPWMHRRLDKLLRQFRELCLAAPRRGAVLAVMGSDGAGKTTLAQRIASDAPTTRRVFTGKHLYRKSFVYKLMVIFIRPLLFQSRESFDERITPLVYLRACLGLRLKLWRYRGKELVLMDRSLSDFLYCNRKTDHPSFSRFRFLSRLAGKRIPTIHFMVCPQQVHDRKPEMTKQGISTYNADMYRHHTLRSPTDYLVFNNDASLDVAHQALSNILPHLVPTLGTAIPSNSSCRAIVAS